MTGFFSNFCCGSTTGNDDTSVLVEKAKEVAASIKVD
jgi:hypothetical protein